MDEGVLKRFAMRSLLEERMCWSRGECVFGVLVGGLMREFS